MGSAILASTWTLRENRIFVPNGHPGDETFVLHANGRAIDSFLEIPATGRNGGPVLPGFLEDD